ncbi:MAG TPA: hypothetical protein VF663_16750 [Telluria sp.]
MNHKCINPACAHALARVVKFCPYCGTPQQGGVARPGTPAPVLVTKPAPAPPPVQAPEEATVQPAAFSPPPVPPRPEPAPQPPPAQPARAGAAPAVPPQRAPLHWIWWVAGLAVLWLAWIAARPATYKVDARIDAAIALAQDCKGKQAQTELIALRSSRATPAQLQRLQTALNQAAGTCERKRVRDKAWADASSAIDTALDASAVERARARLATFTRRYGEDDDTAAAKKRIDAARRAPAAVPAPSREAAGESAQNLIAEAEREISRGNYKGAIDKMETCVGMVDAGNRDCKALKARAERLYQGL